MERSKGWWDRWRRVPAYWRGLAVFTLLASGTLVSLQHRVRHQQGDFFEFFDEGRAVRASLDPAGTRTLQYPPTTQPLFMILSLPPLPVAAAAWWLLNVWFYWQSAAWLTQHGGRESIFSGALIRIALAGVGIVADLTVGQLTGLVLFCVLAAFEMDRRGRQRAGGLFLTIALLVKPLPVVMLPFYALRRRWGFVASVVLCFLLLGPGLDIALFGWDLNAEAWQRFNETVSRPRSPLHVFERWHGLPGGYLNYRESDLAASLIRLFMNVVYSPKGASVQIASLGPNAVLAIWLAIVGGFALWTAWIKIHRRADAERLFLIHAAMVGVMMLANPKMISYWLALGMLTVSPLVTAARQGDRRGRALAVVALGIWLASAWTIGIPVARAAGSLVAGVIVVTAIGLVLANRTERPLGISAEPP